MNNNSYVDLNLFNLLRMVGCNELVLSFKTDDVGYSRIVNNFPQTPFEFKSNPTPFSTNEEEIRGYKSRCINLSPLPMIESIDSIMENKHVNPGNYTFDISFKYRIDITNANETPFTICALTENEQIVRELLSAYRIFLINCMEFLKKHQNILEQKLIKNRYEKQFLLDLIALFADCIFYQNKKQELYFYLSNEKRNKMMEMKTFEPDLRIFINSTMDSML